jgi:HNH endonuclease
MTKEIELTHGQVTIIDDCDFDKVSKYKWSAIWSKHTKSYYVICSYRDNGKAIIICLHRFILNTPKNKHTDHKNHDTLDNRRSNIRVCSRSQNQGNREKKSICSSKYKGVAWSKRDKLWIAYIRVDHHRTHLGCFKNEDDAAVAYNQAAIQAWNEFAVVNHLGI